MAMRAASDVVTRVALYQSVCIYLVCDNVRLECCIIYTWYDVTVF